MSHLKLILHLEKHAPITECERKNITESFHLQNVKKKEVLIAEYMPCNKLFFISNGLLRAYYTDGKGNEVTRRIAWENGFLTNMDSFRKNGKENNETIQCLENAMVLVIHKSELDHLLKTSENLSRIYQTILEKYMAFNIRLYRHLASLNPGDRLTYFNHNYPFIKNRISDTVLATFLGCSRKTLERIRKNGDIQ